MNINHCTLIGGALLALAAHVPAAQAIEGGSSVLDGSFAFPHAVSIQVGTRKYCEGVIVSPSHVITTATCLGPTNTRHIVRAGSPYLRSGGQVRTSLRTTVHPKYDARIHDYDIAILELSRPLVLGPTVQIVSRWQTESPIGQAGVGGGWGSTSAQSPLPSEDMQWAFLTLVSRSDCEAAYAGTDVVITPRMFCTYDPDVRLCAGDEGAPVATVQFIMAGLAGQFSHAQFSGHCAAPDKPLVFVNYADDEIEQFIATVATP